MALTDLGDTGYSMSAKKKGLCDACASWLGTYKLRDVPGGYAIEVFFVWDSVGFRVTSIY